MTATLNQYALRDRTEDKLRARAQLLGLGWLGVFCIFLMVGLSLAGVISDPVPKEEHAFLLVLGVGVYFTIPVAIFLAAWKRKHLPYWVLAVYFIFMPLSIYFMYLKWFDSKK